MKFIERFGPNKPLVLFWGLLCIYSWGWNLRLWRRILVWDRIDGWLYTSRDGTPVGARFWHRRASRALLVLLPLLALGAPCAPQGIVECDLAGPTELALNGIGTFGLACKANASSGGQSWAQWMQVGPGQPEAWQAKMALWSCLEPVDCMADGPHAGPRAVVACAVEHAFRTDPDTGETLRVPGAVRWDLGSPDAGGLAFGTQYDMGGVTLRKTCEGPAVVSFAGLFLRADGTRAGLREVLDVGGTTLVKDGVTQTALAPQPPVKLDRALVVQ